jgi:ABC-type lipoprotein release transport system permease subunit
MTSEPVHVLAALGVAAAFVLLALSALTVRAAILRGWPIGLAVAMAFPPFPVITAPVAVVAALLNPPAELRARGGGFLKPGSLGGISIPGILVGLGIVLAFGVSAYLWARSQGVSGEPMQVPLVRALLVGGLIAGFVTSLLARRVAFLEALWITGFGSLVPVVAASHVVEMFTYGTAPAYYAVILITGGLILLLALVLGGSLGYLLAGDGEVQLSWSYENFIGRRFLMGKRGDSVVGIITVISVLAVAVGTCAMVVVMSVMNGFSTDLRQKIFGANAHLLVLKYGADFVEYDDVVKKTRSLPGVIGATPFVLNEVMVSSESNLTGALLKGIDVETVDSVTVLKSNITRGSLDFLDHPERIPQPQPVGTPAPLEGANGVDPGKGESGKDGVDGAKDDPSTGDAATATGQLDAAIAAATAGILPDTKSPTIPGIVIGAEMSKNLKVFVGDVINVVSPVGELGPSGPVPKARAFRVAAVFFSGMYEYDSKFIYIQLHEAQDFFTLKGAVTGVEYKVADIERTQAISHEMMKILGGYPYRTKDWMEMNRNLFSALKLEKIAMFIILTFIIIVASFLIAATLIVFVIEKSKEIAILKTMGSSDTSIMKVFITYGVIVGSLGTCVGVLAGLSVCFLIKTFGIGLDPDVYYITHLPVHVESFEVALVGAAAVVLSYLATIYPALLAARLRPVEGLRYE